MSKTLTLIDLSSIFWQLWHATGEQEIGEAGAATLRRVYKCVNGDNPVAIAVDMPPYKRKEIYSEYKAQRDKPSKAAKGQLEKVIEHLETDGFPVLGALGYEADDIIATICDKIDKEVLIDIHTGDKDLMQLADERTIIVSVQTGDKYGDSEVFEKFGVPPKQLGDLLALMGDKSDNVPGVPGIGIKRASELLSLFSWNELINFIDVGDPEEQINPPSVRNSLLANFTNLVKSRQLVELMKDAPINVESVLKPRVPKPITQKEVVTQIDEPEQNIPQTQQKPISTSIIKRESWSTALEPRDSTAALKLSKILFESRLYQQFANPQSILAVILRGRALGLDATTALDGFHVVKGRPTMGAHLITGLVLNSGKADYFKCVESTDGRCTYKTHRKDDPDPEPTTLTFTIEKARQMGLADKDNWRKQPDTMLQCRAATALARMVYPDIVAGLYTPDEISDGEYVEAEIIN